MKKNEWMLGVIRSYVRHVSEIQKSFNDEYGVYDILSAKREGLIPAQGILKRYNMASYSFHGVGCKVTLNTCIVDFDFVDNEGINPWFLLNYIKSFNSEDSFDVTLDDVENLLHSMSIEGLLESKIGISGSLLWYFK